MSVSDVEVLQTLRFADDYLSNPDKWTREAFVRYADGSTGEPTFPPTPGTVCACLMGAIRLAPTSDIGVRLAAGKALAIAIDPEWKPFTHATHGMDASITVINFNDNPLTTHADVRRVLRSAIESYARRVELAATNKGEP